MRKLLIASVCLLLLTNVVVLAGVAYNRTGEPLASIELTERELPVHYSYSSSDENSGTSLELKWQLPNPDDDPDYLSTVYVTPAWLDDDKLTGLGFDIEAIKSDIGRYKYRTSNLTADVVLVLEYKGDAYNKLLSLAEKKAELLRNSAADYPDDKKAAKKLEGFEKQLKRLQISQSRIYIVDAGLDEHILMKKYAGKTNYLFVRGEVGLSWDDDEVVGRIRHLYIKQVHVPLPFSEQVAAITKGEGYATYGNDLIPPRYKVRLNIGQRLEPWISSVTKMESATN